MKSNPKKELIILLTIEELGLASVEEIMEHVAEKFSDSRLKVDVSETSLICERWKAKDLLTTDFSHDVKRYKIAQIPPAFKSLKMINLSKMPKKDADKVRAEIEEMFPDDKVPMSKPRGEVRDYERYEITFEAVDPILGGTPDSGDTLKLRRDALTGKPCITPAQFKGWVRQNCRLVGWGTNAKAWIGYSPGIPLGNVEMLTLEAPIVSQGRGRGIQKYEALPPGTKLKTTWQVPLSGQQIEGMSHVRELFDRAEVAPLRGLGANPYYYGGRIKLLEIKQA